VPKLLNQQIKPTMIQDIISLVYPQLCVSCERTISPNQRMCASCAAQLVSTRYYLNTSNPVADLFLGKVAFNHAFSCWHYRSGGPIQKIIHRLKYKGDKRSGMELGQMMAYEMTDFWTTNTIDVVLPVPLHPRKKRLRGYNQCDLIAKGLGESIGAECLTNLVVRKRANVSQTRKGHYDRYQNVDGLFCVNNPKGLAGRRVLLLDDVITTGATMSQMARSVAACSPAELIISSVALAS
jgi:ComF family protein